MAFERNNPWSTKIGDYALKKQKKSSPQTNPICLKCLWDYAPCKVNMVREMHTRMSSSLSTWRACLASLALQMSLHISSHCMYWSANSKCSIIHYHILSYLWTSVGSRQLWGRARLVKFLSWHSSYWSHCISYAHFLPIWLSLMKSENQAKP